MHRDVPDADHALRHARQVAVARLRERGPLPAAALAPLLAGEPRLTGPDAVSAVLRGDDRLHLLPDGRWVELLAALDGRWVTTRPRPAAVAAGVLVVGWDLAAAVRPFRRWGRLPVAGSGRRGLAELATAPSGAGVLVLPHGLLPPPRDPRDPREVVAVAAGPEGLAVRTAVVDEVADARLQRAWRARVAACAPLAVHADPLGDLPPGARPWTPVDVELVVLATDPAVRRTATAPLGALAAQAAGAAAPPAGRRAG